MEETKTKKAPAKKPRAIKAANAPAPVAKPCEPVAPTVRYCGPTSHPSHYHSAVAAQGHKHAWAASIIAGLALILTGSIAFTAVQAETEQRATIRSTELRGDFVREIRELNQRITALEEKVDALSGAAN